MKTRKPDKTVADMGVLKDIRGLLSTGREAPAKEPAPKAGPDLDAGKAALEEKLRQHEAAAREQHGLIDRLEAEKKELQAKLSALESAANKPAPAGAGRLARDISDLEAQKAELAQALAEIEELLQIKIKDLARRIARVYEEAGDTGAARDFRRITNQLEASENFGEFIRALTRE